MHGPETISLVNLQPDDKLFRRIQLEKSLGYPNDQYCAGSLIFFTLFLNFKLSDRKLDKSKVKCLKDVGLRF